MYIKFKVHLIKLPAQPGLLGKYLRRHNIPFNALLLERRIDDIHKRKKKNKNKNQLPQYGQI